MSKQLFVDPNVVRAPGKITFTDIPVNTYQKKVKDELGNFTTEQFKNIYRDMLVLREFETMIQEIKTTTMIATIMSVIKAAFLSDDFSQNRERRMRKPASAVLLYP